MSKIRHATEVFVTNLIDSVKKLVAANSEQINVLSTGKLDKMTFQRNTNIDNFYIEGSHRIFNATGVLPEGIKQGENDLILTCYPLSDGTSFIRKTLLDVRSNKMYLYSKTSEVNIVWEEVLTYTNATIYIKAISSELLNNANYRYPYHGTITSAVASAAELPFEYYNIIYQPNVDSNGYGTQIAVSLNSGILYTRASTGFKWGKWKEIAVTSKADIAFENGWKNATLSAQEPLKVIKTGNMLAIVGTIQGTVFDSWTVVGTLPVGFRPSVPCEGFLVSYNNPNLSKTARLYIEPSGRVSCHDMVGCDINTHLSINCLCVI